MTLRISHRGHTLTQEQLDAITPVLNAIMQDEIEDDESVRFATIEKALKDADCPVPRENDHRNFLIDLVTGLRAAGFTNIRISDPELGKVLLDEVGPEKLADEILSIDDSLALAVDLPDAGRVCLFLMTCNDPFETVYDMGYTSEEVEKRIDEVLHPLEQEYMEAA